MFEQLFRYPGVVERYRAAPLARDRLRYLVHLARISHQSCARCPS